MNFGKEKNFEKKNNVPEHTDTLTDKAVMKKPGHQQNEGKNLFY